MESKKLRRQTHNLCAKCFSVAESYSSSYSCWKCKSKLFINSSVVFYEKNGELTTIGAYVNNLKPPLDRLPLASECVLWSPWKTESALHLLDHRTYLLSTRSTTLSTSLGQDRSTVDCSAPTRYILRQASESKPPRRLRAIARSEDCRQ